MMLEAKWEETRAQLFILSTVNDSIINVVRTPDIAVLGHPTEEMTGSLYVTN